MSTTWWVIICVLCLWVGGIFGMLIHYWLVKHHSYSGTIVVTKTAEKLVYSLEVADPEELQFENEVIFKVNVLDDESQ